MKQIRFLKFILIIIKKDIKIFFRYPLLVFANFFWPLIYPLSMYFLAKGIAGPTNEGIKNFYNLAGTVDYGSFLILGNLLMCFIYLILWEAGLSLSNERWKGTLENIWLATGFSNLYFFASIISASLIQLTPIILSTLIYYFTGILKINGNIFQFILVIIILLPFLIGSMFIFTSLSLKIYDDQALIINIIRTIISILCGLQFPLALLPESIIKLSRFIPIRLIIDILREIAINGKRIKIIDVRLIYTFISGLILIFAGLLLYNKTIKYVRKKAMFTGY